MGAPQREKECDVISVLLTASSGLMVQINNCCGTTVEEDVISSQCLKMHDPASWRFLWVTRACVCTCPW